MGRRKGIATCEALARACIAAHRACLVTILVLLLSGCGVGSAQPAGREPRVVVFAASSLQDAFSEIAGDIEAQGIQAGFSFAGSQSLAAQLAQGAPADVFASADAHSMEAAVASGVVVTGTQRVMAANRLVVAAPAGSGRVKSLPDLAAPGLKLVMADPSVPAGAYSLQALDAMSDGEYGQDFKERVLANVVSQENNVRQVLGKVELGEADAGIVYATDALSANVRVIEIPARYNVPVRYYIAPVASAAHPEAARQFIDYVMSGAGQRTLERFGFGPAGSR